MMTLNAGTAAEMLEAMAAVDAPEFEDNYEATLRRLADYVLDHAPAGLSDWARERLGQVFGGDTLSFPTLAFESSTETDDVVVSASADLYVEADSWRHSERLEDRHGNRWAKTQIRLRVTWPSYSSNSLDASEFRHRLNGEVLAFARRIEREFHEPLYRLIETREQREAARLEQRRQTAQRDVEAHRALLKGMRVSDTRYVARNLDLVPGVYQVKLGSGRTALHYLVNVPAIACEGDMLVQRISAPETSATP